MRAHRAHARTGTPIKWRDARRSSPCPVCEGDSYCCWPEGGGDPVICRRVAGVTPPREDSTGASYWTHWRHGRAPASGARVEAPSTPSAPLAPLEVRAQVNREFLRASPLTSAHRKALRGRGLADEQIDAGGYGTHPGQRRREAAARCVASFGADVCAGVPGLYFVPDGGGYWTVAGLSGLLIPVRTADGQIAALKVRPDDPGDGAKYRWLSSRAHGGPSPGAPPHIPLFASAAGTARLTEGELKADLATALSGMLTVGLPGVSCWRGAVPALQHLGVSTVRLAFDADARRNVHVAKALKDTAAGLRSAGFALELEMWEPTDD